MFVTSFSTSWNKSAKGLMRRWWCTIVFGWLIVAPRWRCWRPKSIRLVIIARKDRHDGKKKLQTTARKEWREDWNANRGNCSIQDVKRFKVYYVLTSFLSIWTLYGYNISMGHHWKKSSRAWQLKILMWYKALAFFDINFSSPHLFWSLTNYSLYVYTQIYDM